jgi:hypothetical protein
MTYHTNTGKAKVERKGLKNNKAKLSQQTTSEKKSRQT